VRKKRILKTHSDEGRTLLIKIKGHRRKKKKHRYETGKEELREGGEGEIPGRRGFRRIQLRVEPRSSRNQGGASTTSKGEKEDTLIYETEGGRT